MGIALVAMPGLSFNSNLYNLQKNNIMKKVLILLVIIALFGCEKERCFECEATCTGYGQSGTATQVYCGQLTRAEAEDMAMSMTYTADGITCRVECREVN